MKFLKDLFKKINLSDISLKKVTIIAIIVVVVLIIIIKTISVGTKNPDGDISDKWKSELTEVTVTKVTDGDTIWVEYEGYKKKIRLIGINCPESVASDESRNTVGGGKASEFTKSLIKKGDTVYLQKDTSDKDKYDRYLRYVWLEQPTDVKDENEVKAKMLNAVILANGYAEAVAVEPDVVYSEMFKKFQDEAVKNQVGLYSPT